MDLIDELERCGIETPAPAPKPRRSPWKIVREENPGARIVRFIDRLDFTQEFRVITPGEKLMDGMTIAFPPLHEGRSHTVEEWAALVAEFDELFHMEREARAAVGQ